MGRVILCGGGGGGMRRRMEEPRSTKYISCGVVIEKRHVDARFYNPWRETILVTATRHLRGRARTQDFYSVMNIPPLPVPRLVIGVRVRDGGGGYPQSTLLKRTKDVFDHFGSHLIFRFGCRQGLV
jgi:hypothetical protein